MNIGFSDPAGQLIRVFLAKKRIVKIVHLGVFCHFEIQYFFTPFQSVFLKLLQLLHRFADMVDGVKLHTGLSSGTVDPLKPKGQKGLHEILLVVRGYQ
jgi:hypothetical protein